MTYISLYYYIFVLAVLLVYYVLPLNKRWIILLTANVAFYYFFYKTGWLIFAGTIIFSYLMGIAINKTEGWKQKIFLLLGVMGVTVPWLFIKNYNFILSGIFSKNTINLIVPLGISFYTLQTIAYLADIYSGKIMPEKNPAKYALFISFFPQLIQGPIPRFRQLNQQLIEGHRFDESSFMKGVCYIIWGFFLKLVIADKAGVYVDVVFNNYPAYTGVYLWMASFLFCIQLYTDFMACTTISIGVSKLFGIELVNNFARPLLAVSIKDFWRRWHISLSSWLKDYIYIPLGGNRKGKCRKYINLFITFLLSGLWHGAGFNFIIWGGIHALYQIVGDLTNDVREKVYDYFKIPNNSGGKKLLKQLGTFILVSLAFIFFRADSVHMGMSFIKHMFTDINPWVFFDDRIFSLGLDLKEFIVLFAGIVILWKVGKLHEEGESVGDRVLRQRLPIRWAILMLSIVFIMIFGTYGFGYNAQDFIYGGF